MENQAIIKTILGFVRENYVTDTNTSIPLDQSLLEIGLLDSFAIIDLVTFLESHYAISIPDSDLNKEKFGSVQRMANYIQSKVDKK